MEAIEVYQSVLQECLANRFRESWLRWHYRSRHESLIAFSNHSFYDYRLVTFPAARDTDDWLGVHLIHVPDGVYDRGGRRTNEVEAGRVADLVLEHLRRHPGKSLGVVSFSMAQKQAIKDELEARLARDTAVDALIERGEQNGFFVKNLEHVQGDERDVMLISVGYGRDRVGRLTMNFGPLNRAGGERRLNVAVTRAKERVILVSSLRASDVDPSQTSAPGVRHLHAYLDFAERGVEALEAACDVDSRDYESPLERDVADVIRQMGYDVQAQVGCSGFRVDLGVRIPRKPGRFILGVECDGATYHSSQTARDRDRLRQAILEGLGWSIYRVWSPAWVRHRATEVDRLRRAQEEAEHRRETSVSEDLDDCPREDGGCPLGVVTTTHNLPMQEHDARPPRTEPYVLSQVSPQFSGWYEFHDPACQLDHARCVAEIVAAEGPVHIEVVGPRLRNAWGHQRLGPRMQAAVEDACGTVVRAQRAERRGSFLWPVSEDFELCVRVPNLTDADSKRKLEHVPPEEIVLAMQRICRDGGGVERDALLSETARVLGYHSVKNLVGQQLGAVLDGVLRNGGLLETGETVTCT